MPDLPNSLALTTIADDAEIIASDHRNNYSAIQTGTNGLITALSGGTSGQVLRATDTDTVTYAYPPAYEYAYNEITSPVSITATSEATANTVATATAVTFDGSTAVIIKAFAPYVKLPLVAAGEVTFNLYDGSTSLGSWGVMVRDETTTADNIDMPLNLERRLTPSAAAHTYSLRAWVVSGTGIVQVGAGGVGVIMPGFIRITKA